MVGSKLFLGLGSAIVVIVLGALFVYLDPLAEEGVSGIVEESPTAEEILDTEPAPVEEALPPGYGDPGGNGEDEEITVPAGGGTAAGSDSGSSGGGSSEGLITIQEDNYTGCVDLFNASTYQGNVTNSSGEYYVYGDITLCQKTYNLDNVRVLRYGAAGVTINCNGSLITGSGSYGVYNTFDVNVLENCNVNGYSTGLYSSSAVDGFLVDNCNFTNHATGYYHALSDDVTVQNSRFENISTKGIRLASGKRYTFVNNTFLHNSLTSGTINMELKPTATNTNGIVKDNFFYGNGVGDYGIWHEGNAASSYDSIFANNTFYNHSAAIWYRGQTIDILENVFLGNGRGIWLSYVKNGNVVDNEINDSYIAAFQITYYLSNTFYLQNVIENNTVDGQLFYYIYGEQDKVYSGLDLSAQNASSFGWFNCISCDNVTIEDSSFSNNHGGHGLFLLNSTNIVVSNITSTNNKYGFGARDGSDGVTLTESTLSMNDDKGIWLYDTNDNNQDFVVKNIVIENNEIGDNVVDGIKVEAPITSNLGAVENVTIRNNEIKGSGNSGNAIYYFIRNSSELLMENNTIWSWNYGFRGYLYDWGHQFINNTIYDITHAGIYAVGYDSTGSGDYAGNLVDGNVIDCDLGSTFYAGLYLRHDNNTIQNNVVRNCTYGVMLDNAGVLYADNNTIYNNYFEGTTTAATNRGYDNNWNLSKTLGNNIYNMTSGGRGGPWLGGNYYSDYPTLDETGDGLGEFPHNVTGAGGMKDYLPLMPIAYSFYNVPAPFVPTDTNGTTKTSGVDKFDDNEYLQLRDGDVPKADIYCQYEDGDCFLDEVVITEVEPNTVEAAQIVAVDLSGVNSSHNLDNNLLTIYLDASWGNGGYVCRGAATVGQVTPNCANVDTFTHAQAAVNYTHPVGNWTVRFITYNGDDYYKVEDLHGTGVASFGNANLTINDSVEGSYGNVSENVEFFAYYINRTSGAFLNGSSCNVTFSDNPGVWFNMDEDTGNSRYNYTKSFAWDATFDWNVSCAKVSYTPLTTNDTVVIGAPAVTAAVPEWSDYALILIIVSVLGGFYYIRKRE